MDTPTNKKPALSGEITDKYELKKIPPGTYDVPGYGIVDLTTISLAKAEQLVKSGNFPLLVEKTSSRKVEKPAEAPAK